MSAGSDVTRVCAVEVEKIRDGLWRWTAPHPDWDGNEGWERDTSVAEPQEPSFSTP